ncbi:MULTISPECIES: DUF2550 family protein [Arsenicicoccus]|uniref:DUF2550 family protein n=1 Tax=Arsenicicoccus TaxID=267408 RepID=UPI0025801004|nr:MULTISPECIES: DUF2550 family protein [Arsenicicoccus]
MAGIEVAEIAVAGALLLLVLLTTLVFVRRRLISDGAPMFLCAVRPTREDPWRLRLARYDTDALLFFTLSGVSLVPSHVMPRAGVEVLGVHTPSRGEFPSLIDDPLVMRCAQGEVAFDLALPRDDCTAVRSWQEARPPGRPPRAA